MHLVGCILSKLGEISTRSWWFFSTPLWKKYAGKSNWDPSSPKKSGVNIPKNMWVVSPPIETYFEKKMLKNPTMASATTPELKFNFARRLGWANWSIYKSSFEQWKNVPGCFRFSTPRCHGKSDFRGVFFSRGPAPGLRRHGMCAGGSGYKR